MNQELSDEVKSVLRSVFASKAFQKNSDSAGMIVTGLFYGFLMIGIKTAKRMAEEGNLSPEKAAPEYVCSRMSTEVLSGLANMLQDEGITLLISSASQEEIVEKVFQKITTASCVN